MPTASVIIKTYNEEENISKAIESSLRAISPYGGEVIVADSGSTDLTTEVASRYPVKVIQLKNAGERCCGIAPQLGFQHSHGDFIYLLDGDMELDADFIALALEALNADPQLAGVGGFVREMRINNSEFLSRQKRQMSRKASDRANVDCLNGGGLYRRTAIGDVGYLSDRNLHSFEEFELGARLRTKGWKLMFLDRLSANHYGYTLGTYRLLWRRIASKYVYGSGEVLRAAIHGKFAAEALRKLPVFRPAIGVWLYWLLVLIVVVAVNSISVAITLLVLALVAPIAVMTFRNAGSVSVGAYSVAAWHAVAFGFLMGLCRRRLDPYARIDARFIRSTSA
jgi:glycosyltransferase involved in cell wall biosynthesis